MTDIPSSIWNLLSGSPLIPATKAAAESWLSRGELGLVIFGFIIIFGLIGEYWADHKWPKPSDAVKSGFHFAAPPAVRPKYINWTLIFASIVVVSIVGEFVSDADIWVTSTVLQTIADSEIEGLKKQNKDAMKKAADALDHATVAERQENILLQENIILEKAIRPRGIMPDDQAKVSRAVSPFAGQQFFGQVGNPISDARYLWATIVKALKEGGWKLTPQEGSTGDPPATDVFDGPNGLAVFVKRGDTDSVPAANALITALRSAGLDEAGGAFSDRTDFPPHTIKIAIGAKIPQK